MRIDSPYKFTCREHLQESVEDFLKAIDHDDVVVTLAPEHSGMCWYPGCVALDADYVIHDYGKPLRSNQEIQKERDSEAKRLAEALAYIKLGKILNQLRTHDLSYLIGEIEREVDDD